MQLNFDDFEEIVIGPFSLPGSKGQFVLKEPTGAGKCAFRDAQIAVSRIEGDKYIAGAGLAATELVLVHACLHEVNDRGEYGKVSRGFVDSLPDRITSKLYDACRSMEDKPPKDSSTGTKDGSESQLPSDVQSGKQSNGSATESTLVG
jgi:hypothetical protein